MKNFRIRFSKEILICLFSVFLAAAGFSRYIETDSGNILIHDIEVESLDSYLYGARLFRPLQASSMNQRPAILIVPGDSGSRYSGDHIAMELSRRGFVVLSIENHPQGTSGPVQDDLPENPVDSGYTFLTTRFFTDSGRTGLITLYSGAETAISADHFSDFTSAVFVSPKKSLPFEIRPDARIFTAKNETDPGFRFTGPENETVTVFSSSHSGMISDRDVIAALLEQFHGDLAIPNDSPFWFDANAQRAQFLLALRFLLLILLFVICRGMGVLITDRDPAPKKTAGAAVTVPAVFFAVISGSMNFFLISVRLGSPFHYLPAITQVCRHFSPLLCGLIFALSVVWSLPLKRHKGLYISDIAAVCAVIVCLFGYCPILFGGTSGWEIFGIVRFRWVITLFAFYAGLSSLLLRIAPDRQQKQTGLALLTGFMFYINCSLLPSAVF